MIYIFDNIQSFSDEMLESAYAGVSQQRLQHALKYRFSIDRKLSVIAYLMLCLALKREYDIAATPQFAYTPSGKPFLPEYEHIHFSLSHCKSAVACALADVAVGVDIEQLQEYNADLVDYCCCDAEKSEIVNAADHGEHFTRIWTQKESALKLVGAAAPFNLASVRQKPNLHFSTYAGADYICSACTAIDTKFNFFILDSLDL